MKTYFLPDERYQPFLLKLTEGNEVFVQSGNHMQRFGVEDKEIPMFGNIRAIEPMKHFFFKSKEKVAVFDELMEKELSPQVILGARRCDVKAMEVYDKMFLEGEYIDPFYKELREKTSIISVDCEEPAESCFCNVTGLKPWNEEAVDLNITRIKRGYIVEVISQKGESIIERGMNLFQEPDSNELTQRMEKREKTLGLLKSRNPEHELEGAIETEKMGTKEWLGEATNCIECCGCLMICPTCYCYLLYDKPDKERIRIWDACFYPAYARVGGGANPRADIVERFRNRFACKFEYSPKNYKMYACTGCGRCIGGCMAKIDIRKVVAKLATFNKL